MANSCSAIIRRKGTPPPNPGNLMHNSGQRSASYWLDKNPDLRLYGRTPSSTREANEIWGEWVEKTEKRYREKRGRKLRSDAIRIDEMLLVVGKDVEGREDPEKVEAFVKEALTKMQEKWGFVPLHVAIHDHEGKSKEEPNIHVHILYSNVTEEGNLFKRSLGKKGLKELQDITHEAAKVAFGPQVQRAIDYAKIGKPAPKQKPHHSYRKEREKEEEKKELKRELDELKEQYKRAREELKLSKEASQTDYMALKKKYLEEKAELERRLREERERRVELEKEIEEAEAAAERRGRLIQKVAKIAEIELLRTNGVGEGAAEENGKRIRAGVKKLKKQAQRADSFGKALIEIGQMAGIEEPETVEEIKEGVQKLSDRANLAESELERVRVELEEEKGLRAKLEEIVESFMSWAGRIATKLGLREPKSSDDYAKIEEEIERLATHSSPGQKPGSGRKNKIRP